MKRVNLITLGCSKNLVDTERIALQLQQAGVEVLFDANESTDIVIINTCGFILDAKQESLDMILQFIEAKERGEIEQIVVAGCLSERYKNELPDELPEVDIWHGTYDFDQLLKKLNISVEPNFCDSRLLASEYKHFGYLKVSDGCNRSCAYCAIPLIKGKHKSVAVEQLLSEAQHLVQQGVKEIILIAQDLSDYGKDLSDKEGLYKLIKGLESIEGLEWIRLHYAYPINFPEKVIELLRQSDKICNYLDVPIQHISDNVLKRMRRGHDEQTTRNFLKNIRRQVPDMAIRTTLLVGFPGETEEDFENLIDFVQEFKFDRLGVFPYSEEEGTYAAIHYDDDIPEAVKQDRMKQIMEVQEDISLEKNMAKVGRQERVLIDRIQGTYFVGRSQYDSPEVDNEIYLPVDDKYNPGDFVLCRITEATAFDLQAEII